MSADLFAEFAAESTASQGKQPISNARPAQQPPPNFSFFDSLDATPTPVAQPQSLYQQQQFQNFVPVTALENASDDNDDWGDFEGDSATIEPASSAGQDPFAIASTLTAQLPQSTGSTTTNIQDPLAFDLKQPSRPDERLWKKAPIIKAKKSVDPSVLFDAEDDLDDDDDFGDFEGVDSNADAPVVGRQSSGLVDLLGDLSVSQPKPSTSIGTRTSINKPTTLSQSTRKKSRGGAFGEMTNPKQPGTKSAPQTEDDGWDTFDDWEASIPTKTPANTSSKRVTENAMTKKGAASPVPILSPTIEDPQPGELPPTNVPPPGVLLSLFPSLFADAQEKLFKPMAAQTLPMRNKLMAEPATINYLQGYLVLANVAAHIIAGRKLRWKRDQHLSQGMRIGPASSRATSGMKLTGIDRGENMKEERETSDVVRVWKEQVGRLRHVVSGTNQIKAGTLGLVPDLQETMPVKTLKQSEGGIPARQPCMMCGLKREERVTATDMATDDSFGEWWIDQVNMHRGCRNFWNQHKEALRQR
ncbi:hypothetical protein HBI56_228490 [Parastagonospora nodorum]|uniref:Uncharacterized protein n=1 Tax=Phaeosphaeria nodorum (strain SN15 / ATCC MYA-4574 / FGSC 10173) TaxID=321614 RepID=A0A7U2NQ26_PHANO|nr:hypothetical protein HBH56_180500 [Parastagonospora nodorum]QRD06270.1 hypothetical protein JI435_116610 [Parastagonospora nodorum SN15]KAH3931761.1 hypothetical protein HBH54_089330 [Parastagonospora nodorum]KAH3972655.1 hypothetical protein HBH51_103420 [Parastagonospora nodorum]KAH3996235.1 hypothetical protein HBI10_159570 [Parastagonospora nodorum]